VNLLERFQDGEQTLLIDQRGKRHLILLRKGETFHSDRGWIKHDDIIGHPDGSWLRTSKGNRCLALRPTLAEYVLDMPRGAQVIYPKDLAMVLFWADIFPVTRVLRSGGIFISYVPTIIQSHQLTEALRRHPGYALVETFETLMRPWNIEGLSVRPFHRMVAHTGFLTVARRVVPEEGGAHPQVEHTEGH
jgi:tRNA A58 N-methylase Trm61